MEEKRERNRFRKGEKREKEVERRERGGERKMRERDSVPEFTETFASPK